MPQARAGTVRELAAVDGHATQVGHSPVPLRENPSLFPPSPGVTGSNMSKTFVIGWKSTKSGRIGLGKALFTRAEAGRIAEELNHDYPEFEHFPVESGEASAPAEPIELPLEKVKQNAA